MKKATRLILVISVMALMLSLAGCMLTFDITGEYEPYVYSSTGLTNAKELVAVIQLKGLLPKWPDKLLVTVGGNVAETVGPSEIIVKPTTSEVANSIQAELYAWANDELDFVVEDINEGDGLFWVSGELSIPHWSELFRLGGASSSVTFKLPLAKLIGAETVSKLETNFKSVCANLPSDYVIEDLTFDAEIVAGPKTIGKMLFVFELLGAKVY